MKTHRTVSGFFTFVLAVAAFIGLLKLLHWFPSTLQANTLREFASMEQARSALKITDVYIPAYFPQTISWPPSRILGQDRPFPALLLEFTGTEKSEVILILSQSRGGALTAGSALAPAVVTEQVPLELRGAAGELTVGECPTGGPCTSIAWSEGGYRFEALMRSTPFELIRIVKSMHP